MEEHVYARISGFGWTLPRAPYRFEHVSGPKLALRATYDAPDGPRSAILTFAGGEPAARLEEGTDALDEVLDLEPGPVLDHWRIETSVLTVRWPAAFALRSPFDASSKFDLFGPGEALIYVQGPFRTARVPASEALAAPGQRILRQGKRGSCRFVELAYEHEGAPWRQWYFVAALPGDEAAVVTAQCREAAAPLTGEAAAEVAASLAPFDDGAGGD